jgi:3-phenylpropionate/trans-cinnamate dioxygenase ferredoxin subunit
MSNWIEACAVDDVDQEDVVAVEHDGCQYAVYRSPDDVFYATDWPMDW